MSIDSSLIPVLFLFTFAAVIGFGIYSYMKAKKARAEKEQSAQAKVQGERPGERGDGVFGASEAKAKEEQEKRPDTSRP